MKKIKSMLAAAGMSAALFSMTAQGAVAVDELKQVVDSYLDDCGYNYTYNEEKENYKMSFSIGSTLGKTDVYMYLYDDMVSVIADCPLYFKEDQFEKVAIFTTLANNDMYYGQFRVDKDYGMISCRNFNVLDSVLPGKEEIGTLLSNVVDYMEYYGDGLAAICVSNADPYETYESIATPVEE